MSSTFSYKKIDLLPDHLKIEVNNYIDFLLSKEKKNTITIEKKKDSIVKFAGIISDEIADEWEKSIAECRKIDINEW